MHQIEIGAVIIGIGTFIARFKAILGYLGQKWTQIAPIALPLILEAEKLAADGKIDRADRKKLVMDGLQAAQDKGIFKLNWWEKIVLPFTVDRTAEALPDISVSQQAQTILAEILIKK